MYEIALLQHCDLCFPARTYNIRIIFFLKNSLSPRPFLSWCKEKILLRGWSIVYSSRLKERGISVHLYYGLDPPPPMALTPKIYVVSRDFRSLRYLSREGSGHSRRFHVKALPGWNMWPWVKYFKLCHCRAVFSYWSWGGGDRISFEEFSILFKHYLELSWLNVWME